MSHPFGFKREKKVKRPERLPVVLQTLATRFKERRNHRTIAEAIDGTALEPPYWPIRR